MPEHDGVQQPDARVAEDIGGGLPVGGQLFDQELDSDMLFLSHGNGRSDRGRVDKKDGRHLVRSHDPHVKDIAQQNQEQNGQQHHQQAEREQRLENARQFSIDVAEKGLRHTLDRLHNLDNQRLAPAIPRASLISSQVS